jgi:N-dimethylarginine dimethylaminohydrolase
MSKLGYGGHSTVGPLRRVALCAPDAADWQTRIENWRDLGYLRRPDFDAAREQHAELRRGLERAGAEVVALDGHGLSLDAVYVHDPSLVSDYGAICLNMGKAARRGEPARHREFYRQLGIPLLGEIRDPGTAEAGDMVWLDSDTLLVGRGYRTNAAGIEQLRKLLGGKGVQVISAPLPHGAGPGCCLHLMSLMSLLDERTALVDLPWLAVETVQLLCERGFRFVEIDPAERDTLACNVLALGEGRLLAIEENLRTNQRLREAGFEVLTFPASEIGINGGGGPTCLTRPILRG